MNIIQTWVATPHFNSEALWTTIFALALLAPIAQQLNNMLTTLLDRRATKRTLRNLDNLSNELHAELGDTR
jgi:hypothetical protein